MRPAAFGYSFCLTECFLNSIDFYSSICRGVFHAHRHNNRCKNPMFAQWIHADRAQLFPQPPESDSLHGRRAVSQIYMYQGKWSMKGVWDFTVIFSLVPHRSLHPPSASISALTLCWPHRLYNMCRDCLQTDCKSFNWTNKTWSCGPSPSPFIWDISIWGRYFTLVATAELFQPVLQCKYPVRAAFIPINAFFWFWFL